MTINHSVAASSSPSTLHCVAGSISAGCFSTLIGHPLDTIKVHQQTNFAQQRIPPPRNAIVTTSSNSTTSAFEVAKILTRRGGNNNNVFRLFKGIGPPMANQIIMNTIMFSTFYKIKENTSSSSSSSSDPLLAGLLSGFVTACISTPTDWIKIQAQLSLSDTSKQQQHLQQKHRNKKNKTDVVSILKRIMYNKDGKLQVLKGVRTLYRGHVANLGREGVFTMVYLGLYDKIISNVVAWGNNNTDDDDVSRNKKNVVGMGTVILISSFTGACAWICNYPFDTIKSVMQAAAGRRGEGPSTTTITTMRSAILSIYKSGGGMNAFFRGVGSSTFRAMLVTSSRMVAYEKTIQLIS